MGRPFGGLGKLKLCFARRKGVRPVRPWAARILSRLVQAPLASSAIDPSTKLPPQPSTHPRISLTRLDAASRRAHRALIAATSQLLHSRMTLSVGTVTRHRVYDRVRWRLSRRRRSRARGAGHHLLGVVESLVELEDACEGCVIKSS